MEEHIMEDLCEAAAMDFALLESPQPVPPCPDPAQIDRYGYLLCKNCSEALDLMFSLRLRKLPRQASWGGLDAPEKDFAPETIVMREIEGEAVGAYRSDEMEAGPKGPAF